MTARDALLALADSGHLTGMSMREVAEHLGVTRQRVHQLRDDLEYADRRREWRGEAPKLCLCLRPADESGLCEEHRRVLARGRRAAGRLPAGVASIAAEHRLFADRAPAHRGAA